MLIGSLALPNNLTFLFKLNSFIKLIKTLLYLSIPGPTKTQKNLICFFFSVDSAFNKFYKNSLYISTYHDQGLIPFKILNSRGINITLGLNYLRMSPAHGTAEDIKYKNKSNNASYLECMIF